MVFRRCGRHLLESRIERSDYSLNKKSLQKIHDVALADQRKVVPTLKQHNIVHIVYIQ